MIWLLKFLGDQVWYLTRMAIRYAGYWWTWLAESLRRFSLCLFHFAGTLS